MVSNASTKFGGTNTGVAVGVNNGSISFQSNSPDDADRLCVQSLRCPNSIIVKNLLKENKDKLHRQSWDWILQTSQYQSWMNSDVCLLWIKGGAGKGKTMMAIGLIEELSMRSGSTVAYSFCQNANGELNTVASIIKGLIFGLLVDDSRLIGPLRRRWNSKEERFTEDCTSWRSLWHILLEMVTEKCKSSKVYLIVDALDECLGNGMADFLRLIVHNGLDQPTRLKWILTSRPLSTAERQLLLTGNDQMQVSLELNSLQISQAIKGYISYKVEELNSASDSGYAMSLKEEMKTQLFAKAEETFLWVSLVCKQLENISPKDALEAIQILPPGMHAFFDQALARMRQGNQDDARKCMRLMQVMMLVYRPLSIAEISILADLNESSDKMKVVIDRCASFLIRIGNNVEFVHQSTRDYLAESSTQSILRIYSSFGHHEVLSRCLLHLSRGLKVNLLGLPRPNSTRALANLPGEEQDVRLINLDYAATFWVRHLANIDHGESEKSRIVEDVRVFLEAKLLELFECLSLLGKTPFAIQLMEELSNLTKDNHSVSELAKDAKRFLLRHSHTIHHWPLQIYSSAIIFSPELSVVKKQNLHKVPKYFRHFPSADENWSSLIQTLEGHLGEVRTVAFSPDGKKIASGSEDTTIKIWDSSTGALEKTLENHSAAVKSVAFSPDGQRVISGSKDKTIKIWNLTGDLERTLKGHSSKVNSVAFSPDGKRIVSGSKDNTVKLWNAKGLLERTLKGHSNQVRAVAFSLDGKTLVSGSLDKTVKLWCSEDGALLKTLRGHLSGVSTVAVSPDGRHIVSGSPRKHLPPWSFAMKILAQLGDRDYDLNTIILWDSSGNREKSWSLWEGVSSIAFSPGGKHFASASSYNNVRIISIAEDADSLESESSVIEIPGLSWALSYSPNGMRLASTFRGLVTIWDTASFIRQESKAHMDDGETPLVFSPDGKKVAFYSGEGSVYIRHLVTDDLQMVLKSKSPYFCRDLAFSPNGRQLASISGYRTIRIWDSGTGDVQMTLEHPKVLLCLAFSPDSKHLVSGSGRSILVWDSITGNIQATLKAHLRSCTSIEALTFSSDGTYMASGLSNGTIILWNTMNWSPHKKFKGDINYIERLLFSPNADVIVSSRSKFLEVWDIAESVKSRCRFGSHPRFRRYGKITSEAVHNIEFSEDCRYLKTNNGPVLLRPLEDQDMNTILDHSMDLFLNDGWLRCGGTCILRLPQQTRVEFSRAHGDTIAIYSSRGDRVLLFDIDRHGLLSFLEQGRNLDV